MIGVDLGLKSDRTVAAVCHAEPLIRYEHGRGDYTAGSKIVLDRIGVWGGTKGQPVALAEVEEWIREASDDVQPGTRPLRPLAGARLRAAAPRAGVVCTEFVFSQSSVGRLGATLHLLIRDRLLALPPDEDLIDELAAVRLHETSPGVVRMDHAHGQHDDRAIALALAATTLLDRPAPLSDDSVSFHVGGDRWDDGDSDLPKLGYGFQM